MSIKWNEINKPIKSMKMIGKNCKWNIKRGEWTKAVYKCNYTDKRCGSNHICDCFDELGKLRFEAKRQA